MIIKMRDTSSRKNDAWFTIGDVKSYHKDVIQYRCKNGCGMPTEGCDECPPYFSPDFYLVDFRDYKRAQAEYDNSIPSSTENPDPQLNCNKLAIHYRDGSLSIAFVGFLDTYVMNDEGKTIDRF